MIITYAGAALRGSYSQNIYYIGSNFTETLLKLELS